MKKPLWDYLNEMDAEFELRVLSTYNIHKDEYRDLIELVLNRFDLRRLELGSISAMRTDHPDFPEAGLCQSYELLATCGLLPEGGAEQLTTEIAQKIGETYKSHGEDCFRVFIVGEEYPTTKIIVGDEEEAEPGQAQLGTTVGEHPDDLVNDNPDLVGSGRVQTFLARARDNKQSREERRKEVLRRVTTTHDVLKDALNESCVRGFYKVRLDEETGEHQIDGPYTENPSDADFPFVPTATKLLDRLNEID